MFFLGIDIGSTTSKAVLLDENDKIIAYSIVRNSYDLAKSGREALNIVLNKADLKADQINCIVSTGYGRRTISVQNIVPEIICHALGTVKIIPTCRTIIDIGGQDSKVIEVDEKGNCKKFQMNDKCAAGTGRYLDKLAREILHVEVEQLGAISLKSKNPLPISAQCTIFAESEIISYLSEGRRIEDIIAGLHNSLAKRVIDMGRLTSIKFEKDIVFTGGVAKNIGVAAALEYLLGQNILVPTEPQLTAALGAALIAKRKFLYKDSS